MLRSSNNDKSFKCLKSRAYSLDIPKKTPSMIGSMRCTLIVLRLARKSADAGEHRVAAFAPRSAPREQRGIRGRTFPGHLVGLLSFARRGRTQ